MAIKFSVNPRWGRLAWIWLTLFIIIADQAAKLLVLNRFALYERWDITSFFSFTLAYNRGAAFSFLSDSSGWQRWLFIAVAITVSLLLIAWLRRLRQHQTWLAVALALILGGALGNLYDRIILGHVIDFILVHYRNWCFPAFNLADSAITIGAIMLIIDTIRDGKS